MELHDQDFLADLYPVAFLLLAVLCELQPVVVHRRAGFAVGAAEVVVDIAAVAEKLGMQEVANTRLDGRNLDAVAVAVAEKEAVGSVAGLEGEFVAEAVEGN